MLKTQNFQNLTGNEYLAADIACKHDKAFEKEHWDVRIQHFRDLISSDNLSDETKKASNPIGMRAALNAWNQTAEGKESGYMISLDASSSGLQLLALLMSCPTSWKLCGGDENILDAYVEIFKQMDIGTGLERADIKQCIMTALYGSEAMPKAIFKDDVNIFYEVMEQMTPGAWELNLGLQDLWDEVNGNTYDWEMPDNFYCCIETQDSEIINFNFLDEKYQVVQKFDGRPRFHKGLAPNAIHSVDGMIVREMLRRCMFDPKVTTRVIGLIMKDDKTEPTGKSAEMVKILWDHYKESGFLSVRILDYLYEDTIGLVDKLTIAELIQSMPNAPFDVITVHDCFRCHPNYGNDLRRQYNTIMADINDSNMLAYIATQIVGRKVIATKSGSIPREVILNGNYLLG